MPGDGVIERIWTITNQVYDKYMQDPLLVPLSERTDVWRAAYRKLPLERLPADLTKAFDRIYALEREKDKCEKRLRLTEEKLKAAKQMVWILGLFVSPVLGALMKALFDVAMRKF